MMRKKSCGGNHSVIKVLKMMNRHNHQVVRFNKKRQNLISSCSSDSSSQVKEDSNNDDEEEDDTNVSFYLKVGKYKKFKYM